MICVQLVPLKYAAGLVELPEVQINPTGGTKPFPGANPTGPIAILNSSLGRHPLHQQQAQGNVCRWHAGCIEPAITCFRAAKATQARFLRHAHARQVNGSTGLQSRCAPAHAHIALVSPACACSGRIRGACPARSGQYHVISLDNGTRRPLRPSVSLIPLERTRIRRFLQCLHGRIGRILGARLGSRRAVGRIICISG